MTGIPLRAHKAGVQTAYTEQAVSAIIRAKKDAGRSLRAIAAEYGFPVNHADIERILQGQFPHNAAKRKALGLPPICASCGQRVKPARVMPEWVNQAVEFLKDQEVLTEFSGLKMESSKHRTQKVYARGGRII
jgi:hypothetical protein